MRGSTTAPCHSQSNLYRCSIVDLRSWDVWIRKHQKQRLQYMLVALVLTRLPCAAGKIVVVRSYV